MGQKLYVGNLSFQATQEEVTELFQAFGEVANVSLVTDRYSGRSRGFAFVEMANEEAATKAREGLNGKPFKERNLTVDWARPEGQGGGSGPRRGGSGGGNRDRSSRRPFRRY
ncbi:MAG: RNA-binding protein [Candidatus Omnitrophica bacterium]|nr:RNA-binding protein [Candidatus Omnitrophota bacterium]